MDISGPIRASLLSFAAADASNRSAADPLALFVHMVADPDSSPTSMPAFLTEAAPGLLDAGRPVHGYFALAAMMRVLPRVRRSLRHAFAERLREQAANLADAAQRLMVSRSSVPVDLVWHHWLLVLARKRLGLSVAENLLAGLWQRGFSSQSQEGHLHPLKPDAALDSFVYDDLAALHAAYNAILFLQDYDRMPQVERAVRWHVSHTQPDHTTTEPWALAAFAGLDDTQTFAAQQLHDAAAGTLSGGLIAMTPALLADALLTQEETAGL